MGMGKILRRKQADPNPFCRILHITRSQAWRPEAGVLFSGRGIDLGETIVVVIARPVLRTCIRLAW
jgi:hypothetical protein